MKKYHSTWEGRNPVRPETLQAFCDRWGVSISWGYRYTRMQGENRLPHYKIGKYIRVLPEEGDAWMMNKSRN